MTGDFQPRILKNVFEFQLMLLKNICDRRISTNYAEEYL